MQSCAVQEREAKRQKLREEGVSAFTGTDAAGTSSRDAAEEPVRPKVRLGAESLSFGTKRAWLCRLHCSLLFVAAT